MLPAFGGAKPPFLLVLALYVALGIRQWERVESKSGNGRSHAWIWTAFAAGYMTEALSGLPCGCCIGFMLPACALAHAVSRAVADMSPAMLGMTTAMLFAPLQEGWLDAWGVTGGGSAFVRFFASALPAAVVGAVLFGILPRLERFAGLRGEVDP